MPIAKRGLCKKTKETSSRAFRSWTNVTRLSSVLVCAKSSNCITWEGPRICSATSRSVVCAWSGLFYEYGCRGVWPLQQELSILLRCLIWRPPTQETMWKSRSFCVVEIRSDALWWHPGCISLVPEASLVTCNKRLSINPAPPHCA